MHWSWWNRPQWTYKSLISKDRLLPRVLQDKTAIKNLYTWIVWDEIGFRVRISILDLLFPWKLQISESTFWNPCALDNSNIFFGRKFAILTHTIHVYTSIGGLLICGIDPNRLSSDIKELQVHCGNELDFPKPAPDLSSEIQISPRYLTGYCTGQQASEIYKILSGKLTSIYHSVWFRFWKPWDQKTMGPIVSWKTVGFLKKPWTSEKNKKTNHGTTKSWKTTGFFPWYHGDNHTLIYRLAPDASCSGVF